jgi:3-hydroxy acid dehydrogenase / malonic semialdehyde reductase
MLSIKGYIGLVTGATSGIGAACAEAFAGAGVDLILIGRRADRLQEKAVELADKHGVRTLPVVLDVTNPADVAAAIAALPGEWANIDILVNNAGKARGLTKIQDGDLADWEDMIDTNIKGLLYVTRAILPGMLTRQRGHIFNLGSTAGHEVYPNGNVYCATKSAVFALNKAMRLDTNGSPIRVTSIDPGLVETEFSIIRFHGDEARAAKVYQGLQPLTPEDVADVMLFCATRPAHVNIEDVVMLPTAQASSLVVTRKTA